MEANLTRLQRKADDLSRLKELMEGSLGDLHQVLSDIAKDAAEVRSQALGQAELPLPAVTETAQDRFGAPIAGSADPAPTRGALLGYCDAVEDAIERNDAEAAKAALRNLRTALQEL